MAKIDKGKLAAAKAEVAKHLAKLDAARAAIADLETAAQPAIAALVEAGGQIGPYAFGDNGDARVLVFRKYEGRYLIRDHEVNEVL